MNYVGSGMARAEDDGVDLDHLRALAASDPKAARVAFNALLGGPADALSSFLKAASRPGEGRLRQMVATVFRTNATANDLEPWLRGWREVESDEFTRNAIDAALESRSPTPLQKPTARSSLIQSAEAYRYVSERLCHRVRNALTLPGTQINRLERLADRATDAETRAELTGILGGLQTGFRRIARSVEFDTDDGYLAWQSIAIVPWLETSSSQLASRFGSAKLLVNGDALTRRVRSQATRFHLDTLFGNLWSNAIQAVEPAECVIEVQCAVDSRKRSLLMLVIDNGSGFTASHLDTAFSQTFSTKSASRGRGLLEMADAVLKLQGDIRLVAVQGREYRIQIQLPIEA